MNITNFMHSGLRIIAAVLFFLLAVEVSARLDDYLKYGAPFWSDYSAELLRGTDRDGIRYNNPRARFEKWRNNSLGFRGPEVARDKAPDIQRVVCFGVSETYGLYESPDHEWPAQLRTMLPQSRYEVVNAASAGLGFPMYPAYLKKHILPLQPDIVVVLVNPSSVFLGYERATATRKSGGDAASRSFRARISDNIRSLSKIKQAMLGGMEREFPTLVKQYALRSVTAQAQEAERYRLKGRAPQDTIPPVYVARFKQDLASLVAVMQDRGILVVLTTYPSMLSRDNLSVHPELFLGVRIFGPELSAAGLAEAFALFNEVVPRVAVETGALFVDGAGRLPKTTEYFADAVHYRDQGARLLAESVAEAILRQNR